MLARLYWTLVTWICRARRHHRWDDWPDVWIVGGRYRPYRRCSRCGAVALTAAGRGLLAAAESDRLLAKDAVIGLMQRQRPLGSGNVPRDLAGG